MSSKHTVADDVVYDLVSIQYHALKGAEVYSRYLDDAHAADHPELTEFIEECQRQDNERAQKCHDLLHDLTKDGIG